MSFSDRPATKAFRDRWENLLAFWKEKRKGPYERDFAEWRIDLGLTPRTARENYWAAGETLGIIRIVYEKREKRWEYCDPDVRTESERPKIEDTEMRARSRLAGIIDQHIIREKMRGGPCAHECSVPEDTDCRNCLTYRSLRNRDFLKDRGEENNF